MKPFVRITALFLAALFLSGAGLAAFDLLTHDNLLRNPELKFAGGWLMSGLMLLALGIRGWPRRSQPNGNAIAGKPSV
jgi:hypothetical protein